MIERAGAKGTIWKDVFFTEEPHVRGATDLGAIDVTCRGQNKDLRNVKDELAKRVLSRGGDTLAEFRYGQRNTWLGGDTWYGSGRVMKSSL